MVRSCKHPHSPRSGFFHTQTGGFRYDGRRIQRQEHRDAADPRAQRRHHEVPRQQRWRRPRARAERPRRLHHRHPPPGRRGVLLLHHGHPPGPGQRRRRGVALQQAAGRRGHVAGTGRDRHDQRHLAGQLGDEGLAPTSPLLLRTPPPHLAGTTWRWGSRYR